MAGIGPVPTPASRTSNRAGVRSESRRPATRSLSRITEDDSHDDSDNDDNTTPRQATNPRRTSFASTSRLTRRSKSRTAVSTTEPGSNQVTPRVKRLKLRPSLAGPQVHEMNIETRAQVLIPIAEDCIVQLLKAGLNGSIYRRNANETWRSAWASLQSQRQNKLFSPDSLPFNDFEDVREAFHSSVRGRINTASLERAIHLSNLATFLWVILQPDEAHTLLDMEERSRASKRSSKRLGGEDGHEDEGRNIRDIVSRRNRVFAMAWKRYWKDVIPQHMRSNKHSINLWARFSVQIMMIFGLEVVDGQRPLGSAADLPSPDPEFEADLFAASAIARYGQWTVGVLSEHDLATKETAQRRWTDVAKRHRTELRDVREEVLVERYPYDDLRREMFGFVDEAILHTLISQSASPRKPVLDDLTPSTSAPEQENDQDREQVSQSEAEAEVQADAEDETDIAKGLGAQELGTQLSEKDSTPSDEPEKVDQELELDLDLDMLAQVLKGMTPNDMGHADELHTDDDDFPSDINSEEPDQHTTTQQAQYVVHSDKEDNDFPSDITCGVDEQDQDAGWAVKDATMPRIRTRRTEQSFQFAARQVSAEQVAWESLSQSLTPRRKAKTPLFLPHHESDSDGGQTASATPRALKRATREISHSTPRRGKPGEEEGQGDIDDDMDDMMPGSSVLGTPARASRRQVRQPILAPSPMRRDPPIADISEHLDREGSSARTRVEQSGPTSSENERPSNSPSPQRPDDHGLELRATTPIVVDRPVASSSRNPQPSSSTRLPAHSQRVFIDPRKRRRTDADADFASASSSDEDSDLNQIPPPRAPAKRVSTPPRQTARRTLGPLRRSLHIVPKSSPRSPNNNMRDFIIVPRTIIPRTIVPPTIVPPIRRPTATAASDNSHEDENGNGSDYAGGNADQQEDTPPARRRTSTNSPVPADFFLYDEDGSSLDPDPEYAIPSGYKAPTSMLHGRMPGQVSQYSRYNGTRRWTKEEEILLYRTVQKVPLDQPYPLRVVQYLHGEFGVLSNDLQDFNPQHMKDKMKTIVQVRYNNDRLIEGRACFWLPPMPAADGLGNETHPDKVALATRVDRAVRARASREREAHRVVAEENQRVKDAEKAAKAAKAEKARKAKKGKKQGKKRAVRRKSTDDEPESEEEEEATGEEEEEVEQPPNPQDEGPQTPPSDESYEPERSKRPRRGTRRPTRGATSRSQSAHPASQEGATSAVPEAQLGADQEVINGVATPDVTPSDTTERPLRRRRFMLCVEVPASRSSSRPISRQTAALTSAQPSRDPSREPISEEVPQGEVSESEAGTEYDVGGSNGRMMRRSIGQTGPTPEVETLSITETEDEDDDDSAEDLTDNEAAAEDGNYHEEIAPIEERLSDLLDHESDPESEEDETQRLELLIRRREVEQKVLRGEESVTQ